MNDRALRDALAEIARSSAVQSAQLYAVQRAALGSNEPRDLDKVTQFVIAHVFGALAQRLEGAGDEQPASQYEAVINATLAVLGSEPTTRVKQLSELVDLLGLGRTPN